MTHHDQLLELFGQANPVPDPDIFKEGDDVVVRLEATEQWSEPMQMTEQTDRQLSDQQTGSDRGRWIVSVAAVVVAILGLGGAMVMYQQSSDAASPEIAAVQVPFAALNDGDFETYAEAFSGEERTAKYDWRNQYEADFVADLEWSVENCTLEGVDAEGLKLIACDMSRTSDFLKAGGIVHTGRSVFHVDENLMIVAWDENMVGNDKFFHTRFIAWMNEEHDEHLGAWNVAVDVDHGWWNRTPVVMEVALQYVDEFVAQSDRYPIAP